MLLDIILNNLLLQGTVVWLIVSVIFLIATARRDNSIMDIAYGPTFAIAALALLYINERLDTLATVLVAAIILWAARLGTRIARKNYGRGEDPRYAAWRTAWQARGTWYLLLRSYGQIYLLQGAIITIVGLPVVFAVSFAAELSVPWLIAGALIAAMGLTYEAIADHQLDQFLHRKRRGETDADLMQTGLFWYSRRPNYFGESVFWWGLAIMVVPLPYGWLALLSPLTITYIVTRITGPMLEAQFLSQFPDAYREYMRRTSYFIPLPPRSS